MAELNKGIALVGVLPPFVLGGSNGCNCGSTFVTTPGHAPNGGVPPEPFCMIRLPAPVDGGAPPTKHSLAPLLAMMVLLSVRL